MQAVHLPDDLGTLRAAMIGGVWHYCEPDVCSVFRLNKARLYKDHPEIDRTIRHRFKRHSSPVTALPHDVVLALALDYDSRAHATLAKFAETQPRGNDREHELWYLAKKLELLRAIKDLTL